MDTTIRQIRAREILDSRGNPTIETEVELAGGSRARASVPGGASTGQHEAKEARDGDPARFGGKGVQHAIAGIHTTIAPALAGMDALEQRAIDGCMLELDGTAQKERLGANAILSVSLAVARVAAQALRLPLFRYLGGVGMHRLPCPMFNLINAGMHSDAPIDFQEFMIVPRGISNFSEALRCGSEVFHALGEALRSKGFSTAVGDEGGYAPALRSAQEVLDMLLTAICRAGYRPGEEVFLALDAAASTFYDENDRRYHLRKSGNKALSSAELITLYAELVEGYPICSIEDGCAEDDWEGWSQLTRALSKRCMLVGDDLFVTNPLFLQRGIEQGIANAILIKPNQIGTLTETLDTMQLATSHAYTTIVSHRSGETIDSFIADLSLLSPFIKAGAPSRGERLAKYNRLLEIASIKQCPHYQHPTS